MPTRPPRQLALLSLAATGALARIAPAQLTGQTSAHDPSTLIKSGTKYYYYSTGQGILSRSSTNLTSWSTGPSVFSSPPAWTTQAVPGFTGLFWAPDVIFRNNQYYLYYAVSTFGSHTSAIGLATTPTLDPSAPNYAWTDQGAIIQSNNSTPYNTIDPSILQDTTTGRLWMSYGSYWSGIFVTELDPATGKRLPTSPAVNVATGPGTAAEASALIQRDGYYYLFVNWGSCCDGVDSTYNIRVGRSTSPTGPFLDKTGANLLSGGGSLFLDDDGKNIGPGHFGLYSEAGHDYFSYHYYNGDANGAPTYGLRNLYWSPSGWPSYAAVNPTWTGATSSGWSQPANWSDGPVPDAPGNVANFSSASAGRFVVSLDGAPRTLATLNFAGNASYMIGGAAGDAITLDATAPGDPATINVSASSHTIAAAVTAVDNLGVNVTPATSTLTLSSSLSAPTLTKYGYGTLLLGGTSTFTGSVFARRGTLDVTGAVSAAQYVSVGPSPGDSATLNLRAAATFSANSDFNVGDTGDSSSPATGTLNLSQNASLTVGSAGGFFVGSGYFSGTRAVGTVNQSGGALTANGNFDGAFVIGGRTSSLATGTYNLSGGSVTANTNVQVGGHGIGAINQTGGSFSAPVSYVSVGRYAGSAGTWTLSGGSLSVGSPSRLLIVGESGNGTLTLSGTAQVSTAGALRLGHATGGAGTVNLDGGVLTAPAVSRGPGAGTFNFNGGTLRAAAPSATFLQGLTSAYVQAGNAVIDSNSFNVTIAQPLLHDPSLGSTPDGGLTKTGPGALTLTGANTYTGPTVLAQGQLLLRPAAANTLLTGPSGANVLAGQLVFDYAVSTSPRSSVLSLLTESHSLNWTGGRMRSTSADATHSLGWLDDPTASRLTVAYTLNGDANLDGVLNADDYAILDRSLAVSRANATWSEGDFNYDGIVNNQDYLLIDSTLAQQQGGHLSPSFLSERESQFGPAYVESLLVAIPEPTPAYAVALVFALLPFRRRRAWGLREARA